MNYILKEDEINGVDIELTGCCNLKCPLCLSQMSVSKNKFNRHFIDIDKLIEQLDRFTNLHLVSIAGDASEPTIHPQLVRLLDYTKNRNGIFTELYTNAQLYDNAYWTDLNKHFNENSVVYFTICGTTQDLHEKYRVGSNLNDVISHALAFKKNNPHKNDLMQYIRFEYNKNDDKKEIYRIFSNFSQSRITETDPIYERFNLNEQSKTDIASERMFSTFYRMHLKKVLKKKNKDIMCHSFKSKYVRIDNNMVISPCVCYRLYNDKSFLKNGVFDYNDIYGNKCDFCFECDKDIVSFLDKHNRDSFFNC